MTMVATNELEYLLHAIRLSAWRFPWDFRMQLGWIAYFEMELKQYDPFVSRTQATVRINTV
jgi:hypothetical protein